MCRTPRLGDVRQCEDADEFSLGSGYGLGGNACQGQSACNTASTRCAGQNSCKGQGWIVTTKAECDEKGGTFEAS